MLTSSLFAGDPLLQRIADDVDPVNDRISTTLNNQDPAVQKVQIALLHWDPTCIPSGATGFFGNESAAAVRKYKEMVLGVAPAAVVEDVGPLTVQTLDAMETELDGRTVVQLVNEYDEPLGGVTLTLTDPNGAQAATTDGAGEAVVLLAGDADLALDPAGAIAVLGDLLDRPWPGAFDATAVLATPANDLAVTVARGGTTKVVVVSRLRYDGTLVVPPEGAVMVDGGGLRVDIEPDGRVSVAIQANGGVASSVTIDPIPSGLVPPALPALVGWVAPNGYVVRTGDTADSIGSLFLGDPARFAELSDHPPVVGETLTLPDAAVPPWLGLALDPTLPDPVPVPWFSVVPDDLLRAFYADGDPSGVLDLLAVIDFPPSPGPDPLSDLAARGVALSLVLSSSEVLGPEPAVGADEAQV